MSTKIVALCCLFSFTASATEPQVPPGAAFVWIVDVGNGLCTVAGAPNSDGNYRYMVYDAGNQLFQHATSDFLEQEGSTCADFVGQVIRRAPIDIFVISHSDADHLNNADDLIQDRNVGLLVRTGQRRRSSKHPWPAWDKAIKKAVAQDRLATDHNLARQGSLPHDQDLGRAKVSFVAGWARPDSSWTRLSDSKRKNVISIVVRLQYAGNSVLFTGDTVGRAGDDGCRYAEKFMVDNAKRKPIASDVMLAPHHGADGSSSACFIERVDPTYVVFSAGTVPAFRHPRRDAVRRYLCAGVEPWNIFRTDRCDHPAGSREWPHPPDCGHAAPDEDHVLVVLPESGEPTVTYHASRRPN